MSKIIIKLLHSGAGLPIAVCISLLAAACASKTSVSSDWLDKNAQRPRFERALVVGIAAAPDRRLSFENAVANSLRRPGTEALASSNFMSVETELNEQSISRVAEETQADVVLVTRVTKLEIEPVEVEGRSQILAQEQQSGSAHVFRRKKGTLFQYEYDEDIEPTYVTSQYTVELTTDVYDVASDKIIYVVRASASEQETLADVIDVLSKNIVQRLRRDKVIE